jgi:hypothetical protein
MYPHSRHSQMKFSTIHFRSCHILLLRLLYIPTSHHICLAANYLFIHFRQLARWHCT